MPIGVDVVAEMLRIIRGREGGEPQLQFSYSDGRVFWQDFHTCSTNAPSLDVGQSANCRWSFNDGSALHAQWFDQQQFVRFHIDGIDPERDGLGHLLHDTHIGKGVLIGALLGALTGKWRGVAAGAALGGLGGAAMTTSKVTVYQVNYISRDGRFEYSSLTAGSLPIIA